MVSKKNEAHFHNAAANTIALAAIGISLGNLAGIGFVIGMIDTLSCQIAAVFIRVFHAHTSPAQLCVALGGIPEFVLTLLLGFVVAPAIMSGIARRLPILWGMLPPVIFNFWTTADYMSANSIKFSVSSVIDTYLLDAPLILIGVVSSFVLCSIKHSVLMRHFSQ